ncbi:MAG TPA: cytochrome c [Sandaracinaceae bacterium LLY-WYZ-13_1]|nr:cytochrome c [Sandaracinaceae bacterium LLY-WYZ-13_1]
MSRRPIPALLALAAFAVGCQGQTSEEPPIVPIRNMHDVPRYDSQAASPYFEDGRAMRPPVPNTIPREAIIDPVIDTGVTDDGTYQTTIPEPVVEQLGGMEALVERGQDRYEIYCVPCHGSLGDGQGLVGQVSGVATIQPPSFHDDRIRHMPDGQLYATIRNGIRNMPAYQHNVPVVDRWAIVSYVRALQLHQQDGRTAMATETDR